MYHSPQRSTMHTALILTFAHKNHLSLNLWYLGQRNCLLVSKHASFSQSHSYIQIQTLRYMTRFIFPSLKKILFPPFLHSMILLNKVGLFLGFHINLKVLYKSYVFPLLWQRASMQWFMSPQWRTAVEILPWRAEAVSLSSFTFPALSKTSGWQMSD